MNYIIFGGSGFIGTHLIKLLKQEAVKDGDKIYDLDIVLPGEEGVVPGIVEKTDGVNYIRCDVRHHITEQVRQKEKKAAAYAAKGRKYRDIITEDGKPLHFVPTPDDIIFNFAAIHRTPGHPDHAYFDTNIHGAERVTEFAREENIKKILFTSSIAPYAASEEKKTEKTLPTPNTPYGISKLTAEKIHLVWQAEDKDRELTIVRPGVVYGKGEHGNFTRLYKGIRGHYFMYTGRKDTIKACIYVKELVRFMKWRMVDHDFKGADIFNMTFEPAYTIEQICNAMMKATGMKRFIPLLPGKLLMAASVMLIPFGGKKLGLHPARVKKLMVSTNISGKKLAESGYHFHYTLEESLHDWYEDCDEQGLF